MRCRLCKKVLKDERRLRCGSCNTKVRRYRTKLAAIKLLGGRCEHCGWSGHPAGFEFHHPNNDKEDRVSDILNRAWETVRREVRKCMLLCVRCHKIHHATASDDPIWQELEEYRGRKFDYDTPG